MTNSTARSDSDLKGGEPGPVTIPRELFDFLMGVGEIDGTNFGDLNDGLPGRFWWRALLRTAERQSPENNMRTVLELIARRNGAWSQLARATIAKDHSRA